MSHAILPTKEYILYILNKLEPENCDKLTLNKIAFLVEFAYVYFHDGVTLTDADYAGITHGPVINNYKEILSAMEKEGLIKIDGNKVRPLKGPSIALDATQEKELDSYIQKYAKSNKWALRALTHEMDSYLIATDNESSYGKIIDKDLALLESFFEDEEEDDESADKEDEEILATNLDKENLIKI